MLKYCFFSQIESSRINDALDDEQWILAMQEELIFFKRNKVWELVPKPIDKYIIGEQYVFNNKLDEKYIIVIKKARLVA